MAGRGQGATEDSAYEPGADYRDLHRDLRPTQRTSAALGPPGVKHLDEYVRRGSILADHGDQEFWMLDA
jgi:hypothetical protein